MPIPDPRAGYATIWFISCFLFISIAVGGGFLVMYMILPESDSTYWLPVAGVTLVCLPWLFWFCTCTYRIVSRLCGFRIGCWGGVGEGGGGGGGCHGDVVQSTRGRSLNSNHGSVNNYNNPNNSNNNNEESQGRKNNSGQNDDNISERKESGDSTASRESEIPFTSSMAP